MRASETTSEEIDRRRAETFRSARLSSAFGTFIDQKRRQIARAGWKKFETVAIGRIESRRPSVAFDLEMIFRNASLCVRPLRVDHFICELKQQSANLVGLAPERDGEVAAAADARNERKNNQTKD